jgi:uncharacterized protein (DUF58 family)
MRTEWIRHVWVQFGLALLVLGLLIGREALAALAVFLLAGGYLAWKWSRNVLDRVRYERVLPENRAFAGEKLSLTLRLVNDKLLPIPWLQVKDTIPEGTLQGEAHLAPASFPNYVVLTRSTHLSWYERITWPLELEAPARGYYRLGPAQLTSGDIFGFFEAQQDDERMTSLIIYPAIYSLKDLGLPAERPFGERKGRERIFEDPSRIAGLRDYRPGDPMRRIDWKASARRQELQSRVYEPSSTLHLLIAVNVHTLEHSWEGYVPEMLEEVLSVAGSVAHYGFEAGYAIGLVANGAYPESDRPMRVPVGRRSDQLARVLEALAVIGPLTLVTLESVLDREAQSFPFGATLVCVTARMDEGLAASLRRIADGGHSVTVLSLGEEGLQGEQDLGKIRVFDLKGVIGSQTAQPLSREAMVRR